MDRPTRAYKDRSLFDDVALPELRAHNRGNIMANIMIDNIEEGKTTINPGGTKDLLTYFSMVPKAERKAALQVMMDRCKSEGYTVQRFV